MNRLLTVLTAGAVMAPSASFAATPAQINLSAYIGGQIICSLTRHGAPESVVSEEMQRVGAAVRRDLGIELTQSDVKRLVQGFERVLETCPPRSLPDA